MMITNNYAFFFWVLLLSALQSVSAMLLLEQFKHVGYVEIYDQCHGAETFEALYTYFDEFISFLQTNPVWPQKLYSVKERFIRSKERDYYSTDIFGLYDESEKKGRNQISFYYCIHFHEFIDSHYKEFNKVPQIIRFFEACREIQKSYVNIFNEAAIQLGLGGIFSSSYRQPPILLKVIKYLPSYRATTPHYDGSAFSLFLDSTDNQSLFLAPYKASFTIDDFSYPLRKFSRSGNHNSIVLIPGTLLADFSIDPTPHIAIESGTIRYATIAFAMRPHYIPQKNKFSTLPNFSY